MTDETVGAHHCEPGAISALLADLDAIGECRESPPLLDRDHRAMAGVVACVIRHLQCVGIRLAVDNFNLKGELREAQERIAFVASESALNEQDAFDEGYEEGINDAEGALL